MAEQAGTLPEAEDWREYGQMARALRESKGLTQQMLADQIGASPAWLSQVESGDKGKPGDRLAAALEAYLGPDLRALRPSGANPVDSGRPIEEPSAYPLLWRARIDLLRALAMGAKGRPFLRQRLVDLASSLEYSAGRHPLAAGYVHQATLLPLHRLSDDSPEWVRRVVLAEVACMKVDAPFETGVNRDFSDRYDALTLIASDSGLEGADTAVTKSIKEFKGRRDWPTWQDMPCVGGGKGTVQALQAGAGRDLEILIGHDPVGWLGFDFAAGRWLLTGADRSTAKGEEPRDVHGPSFGSAGLLAATAVGAAALLLPLPGLGPVLGGAALAGVAARAASKRSRHRGPVAAEGSPPSDLPTPGETADEPLARLTALAQAIGRHWVRVDACKLASLYACLPHPGRGDADAGLPPARDAAEHLASLAATASRLASAEARESGTKNQSANYPYKTYVDISETLATASALIRSRA